MSDIAESGANPLDFVRNELACVRREWKIFRRIAVIGENDDGILGQVAPEFQGFVHRALLRDVTLALSRLFEGGSRVLSLRAVLNRQKNHVSNQDFEQFTGELTDLELAFASANLENGRNQIIAHNARPIAMRVEKARSSNIAVVDQLIEDVSEWVAQSSRSNWTSVPIR